MQFEKHARTETHVHVNKTNVDGTASPSNKIAWISCSVLITKWHLFHLLSMTNELK